MKTNADLIRNAAEWDACNDRLGNAQDAMAGTTSDEDYRVCEKAVESIMAERFAMAVRHTATATARLADINAELTDAEVDAMDHGV